jgi:hypothetical protein
MSTPIQQLGLSGEHQQSFDASVSMEQPNMNPPSDIEMVNRVMESVGTVHDDPHASNISGEMMSHNMDPSQIPPEQQYQYMQEDEPIHYGQPYMEPEAEAESWTQKVQNGVKGPFLVFIVALLINLPHVTRMLTHFVPKLLQESGQLNFYGVLVKAILIAFLYGVISLATN